MPKPDGTMTFEEYMDDLAETIEFDEGDTPEKFLKLGKEVIEEGLRKKEVRTLPRGLRRCLKNQEVTMRKSYKISPQLINFNGMQYAPEDETWCRLSLQ